VYIFGLCRVLREMYGTGRKDITEDGQNITLTSFRVFPNRRIFSRAIKWRMIWAGYVARMGGKGNAYRVLGLKADEKRPL